VNSADETLALKSIKLSSKLDELFCRPRANPKVSTHITLQPRSSEIESREMGGWRF